MKTYLFFLELGPPEIRVGNLSNLKVAFTAASIRDAYEIRELSGIAKKKELF
jgi:hypothetical protein